jgi:hypothetical protein
VDYEQVHHVNRKREVDYEQVHHVNRKREARKLESQSVCHIILAIRKLLG